MHYSKATNRYKTLIIRLLRIGASTNGRKFSTNNTLFSATAKHLDYPLTMSIFGWLFCCVLFVENTDFPQTAFGTFR